MSGFTLSQVQAILRNLFPVFFSTAQTSQHESKSISEILRSFQRNEKLLLILYIIPKTTKQIIFSSMSSCNIAGQSLQLQNQRSLQERNSLELGYNRIRQSFQQICRDCKPQGHFISSLWVNFALCCLTSYMGQRNDQPFQINQNNHPSVWV